MRMYRAFSIDVKRTALRREIWSFAAYMDDGSHYDADGFHIPPQFEIVLAHWVEERRTASSNSYIIEAWWAPGGRRLAARSMRVKRPKVDASMKALCVQLISRNFKWR